MAKLSILIECDTEKKLGTVVKLDQVERNKRRLYILGKNTTTAEVKELIDKLKLPQIPESRFSHHLFVFDDEEKAVTLFNSLVKYTLNPRIYDMCYGKISPDETMKILA